MLASLHIQNYAIVSSLHLNFEAGMTVFTGETGAGKSIMIDALMLALGGRADATVVRPSTDKCDITAHFYLDNDSKPAAWLASHDIPFDNNEVTLRRTITVEGRSKAYINAYPFPLNKVKELSEMLVDIHGQHQHQTLLKHGTHREQLDQYANHPVLRERVQALYTQSRQLKQQLDELQGQSSLADRIALLHYQVEELEALGVDNVDVNGLFDEQKCLQHAQDFLAQVDIIRNCLQADEQTDVSTLLNQVLQSLSQFPDNNPHVKAASEMISNAMIQCEEARDEIEQFAANVQLDPERLQVVEDQLSRLHQTARKYHVDIEQLPEHFQQLTHDLHELKNLKDTEATVSEAYQQCLEEYDAAALALRQSREKQAIALSQAITESIQPLGMPKGNVTIELTPLDTPHPHGLDKVEYKVCTNPGMPPDSLAKIASGGELSRIGLAIQMITAQRASTPTLLFDEVDVGIGGGTASLVGQHLRSLGDRLQVFCVTHQPQVASCAHQHFKVVKHTEDNQTFSEVSALDKQTRVEEVARMLGGVQITAQTRSHAEEMIEQS